MSELPKNFIDEFLDLKRRISTLERATRVPNVTGAASGPQVTTITDGVFRIPPSGTAGDLPVIGSVEVDAMVTPKGTVTVLFGARSWLAFDPATQLSCTGSLGMEGANTLDATAETYKWLHLVNVGDATGSLMFQQANVQAVRLTGLEPGLTTFHQKFRHDGTHAGGSIADPWLMVLPI